MRARVEVQPYQRILATLGAAAVAPVVPRRLDPAITRTVSALHLALLPRRRRQVADQMATFLRQEDRDFTEESTEYWLQRVESRWGVARGIWASGWKPAVEITGLHHITESATKGRGTILWRISGHSAIPINQVLADHGFAPVHLSKSNHLMVRRDDRLWRFVGPRVGPVLWRPEVAPLKERVQMGDGVSAVAATRRLMAALKDNEVVTIVGDLRGAGRKVHQVQIHNGKLRLPNGGAKLAVKAGAALLPVSVSRTGPLRYRVDVHEPLTVPTDVGTNEAVVSLIEQFADVVADFVGSNPSDWSKWRGWTS